tara:strand:- start:124 stop:1149 length:1026 start_codon:yes stop_codon:yes gene_type:complete
MSEEITDIQQETNPVEESAANPISERVTVDNEMSDDAMLDKIMGSSEPEGSVAEAEVESVQLETEVAADTEVATDAVTPSEPGEDYHRAMAALQRDGTPRDVLDYMYEQDPDSFVSWGLKREKVQRDGDKFGDEYSKLKSRLEQLEAGGEQPTADSTQEQPPEQAVADPARTPVANQTFEKTKADMSEIFGEEAAEVLMQPIAQLSQSLAAAIQQIQTLTGHAEARELSVAKESLRERFPQLDAEDAYQSVVDRMKTLYKSGDYDNIRSLMTDAARIVFADEAPPRDTAAENKAKSLGQPTVATKTKTATKTFTHEDREDAALDAIFDGDGLDGAKKAYTI